MLDSRPDLLLPPAVVPHFFQPELLVGKPFPHSRALPGFRPSVPFSHHQGHQMQGALSDSEEFLRPKQPAAQGCHPMVRAVYNLHQFAHTDPSVSEAGDRMAPVPHLDPAVAYLLDQKQTLCRRLSAHLTLPQPQPALAAISAQDCLGFSHCPGGYQSGHIHDIAQRNIMFDLESVSVARSVRSLGSIVPTKRLSGMASNFAERTTQSRGQSGQYDKWWKSEHALAVEHDSYRQQEREWKAVEEAKGLQEKTLNNTVNAGGFLLASFMKSNAFGIQTVSSQLSSPHPVSSSSATPAGEGSVVSLTRPSTPQAVASDLKEPCLRTFSGETGQQKLRKGPAHRERLCRLKRYKDNALPDKRHSLMSSRSSLTSKAHKNRKVKFPPRFDKQPSQSGTGHALQEEPRKTFHCAQCRYVTDRKNNLKRHVVTMHHKTSRVLECCGTIFHSKASLRDHVTLYHRGGYRCQVCGRNFCRKALLRRHLTVHSGQKDFACRLCGYATSHKSNLERHQRVHVRKTTFFGHNLPLRHPPQEATTESARFTSGRTEEYESDDRSTDAVFTHAFLSKRQEDQNHRSTGKFTVENQVTCHSSENRYRHLAFDKPLCHQDGALKDNICWAVSNIKTADRLESTGGTSPNCSYPHLFNSNNTEVSYSPQLREESQRVCRDATNISSDVTSFPLGPLYVHCNSPAKGNDLDAYPLSVFSSFSATSKNGSGKLDVKNTSCSRKAVCSRSWLLSRKVCFPNRLTETYHSAEYKTASEISTTDNLCPDAELEEDGVGDVDDDDDDDDDIITITESVKENEVPPQHEQPLSLKPALSRSDGQDNRRNRVICPDKGRENRTIKFQSRNRMCSLLYRCSGCRACFAHQGELNGHVCQLQDGCCILDFPVTSSVKKGCLKLYPSSLGDAETRESQPI